MSQHKNGSPSTWLSRTVSGAMSASPANVFWGGSKGFVGKYPGASAGYSLRKLGSGPVVRLRRANDNAEEDFTASDVVAGTYLSDELNPDPNFADAGAWTVGTGWTVSGGTANLNSVTGSGNFLTNNAAVAENSYRYYKVTFTIDSISSIANIGLVLSTSNYREFDEFQVNGAGTYSVILDREITDSVVLGRFFVLGHIPSGQTMQLSYFSFRGYQPSAAELWTLNGLTSIYTYTKQDSDSAFCTTWYDQSASGNNATQPVSTAQPLLIRAGVTNTENGKAALSFDGVDDVLKVSGDISSTASPHTILAVSDLLYDTGVYLIRKLAGSAPQVIVSGFGRLYNDSFSWRGSGGELGTGQQNLGTFKLKLNSNDGYSNGVLVEGGLSGNEITLNGSDTDIGIGGTPIGGSEITGDLQELIIYPSDQSANRIPIEDNISKAWCIPYPTMDLVGDCRAPEMAAGYSLRDLGGGGNVVRLRRFVDNAEEDFTAGDVAAGTSGAELLTNGDFSDGSTGWTLGTSWSISGGQAVCDGSQIARENLAQNLDEFTSGGYYLLSFDIVSCSDFTGCGIRAAASGGAALRTFDEYQITSTGSYSALLDANINQVNLFQVFANAGVSITVDNISVIEYIPSAPELWAFQSGIANQPWGKQTTDSAFCTTWYDQSASNEQVFPNPSISAADWSYAVGPMDYSINDGRLSMSNVTGYSQFNITSPALTGIESGKTYRIEFDYENCTHANGFALVLQFDGNVFTIAPSTGSGTASKDIVAAVSGDVNGWFQTNQTAVYANGGIDVTGVRVTEIGNPATQTTSTAQPLLIRAGVTATDNGKAALEFDGVDDNLNLPNSWAGGDLSYFIVNDVDDDAADPEYVIGYESTDSVWLLASRDGGSSDAFRNLGSSYESYVNGAKIGSTGSVSQQDHFNAAGLDQSLTSVVNADATLSVSSPYDLGTYPSQSFNFDGSCQELILYPSDQTANRTIIETNINAYYGIWLDDPWNDFNSWSDNLIWSED